MRIMPDDPLKNSVDKEEDSLLSGRGSPALMSLKEPALRLLTEKYSERFALTRGEGERVHLFVIKFSLWGLVRTFVPKDLGPETQTLSVNEALALIETALNGQNEKLRENIDTAVAKALSRIVTKSQ